MKNYRKYLVSFFALAAAMTLVACDKNESETGNGPTLTWTDDAGTKSYDFSKTYDHDQVQILLKAVTENTFTKFTVDIDSDVLTSDVLGIAMLSTHLDLIDPGSAATAGALTGLGFPTGTGITSKKTVQFSNTSLMDMLTMLNTTGYCNFKLTVGDESGTTVKTIKLKVVAVPK